MPNSYFQFQQFKVKQEQSGMKVTTDACLFGAWVANQLPFQEPKRILDMGTGTGLLALMLAQATINTRIDAIELNQEAFKEASDNFRSSPWPDRLMAKHQPLQHFSSEAPYEVMICNPPFFQSSQSGANRNKNQAIHADHLTLEDLVMVVDRLLNKDSIGYFLYPEREMETFITLVKEKGIFCSQLAIVRNKIRDPVFRMMGKFERSKNSIAYEEIIIRQQNNKYTNKTWSLLKDYYLPYNNPNFTGNQTLV